jgi:multicomponent Na+:H+ antiporter subunit E
MLVHPVVTVLLALVWCFLLESFRLATFLSGLIIAAAVEYVFRRIIGSEVDFFRAAFRLRKLGTLAKLAGFFLYELVLSNIQVAIVILRPRLRVKPALIQLPIELENDVSITMLANMISLTPGTVTVDVAPDRKSLTVHCLNVEDIEATKRTIKDGFERRLAELER